MKNIFLLINTFSLRYIGHVGLNTLSLVYGGGISCGKQDGRWAASTHVRLENNDGLNAEYDIIYDLTVLDICRVSSPVRCTCSRHSRSREERTSAES